MGPRDIGWAVRELLEHRRVARAGWNGRGMYLELQLPEDHGLELPFVAIGTAAGLVPWTCSQTDLLAVDWCEA